MADPEGTRDHVRRARELMLAIFTLWLVVQNGVLLMFLPWTDWSGAMVVVNALIKAAFLVLAPLWVLPLAILVGAAVTAYAVRGTTVQPGSGSWGVRHG